MRIAHHSTLLKFKKGPFKYCVFNRGRVGIGVGGGGLCDSIAGTSRIPTAYATMHAAHAHINGRRCNGPVAQPDSIVPCCQVAQPDAIAPPCPVVQPDATAPCVRFTKL